jgi:xanthine/CO dehydrogenase XdhC/CoxF family maturation factor
MKELRRIAVAWADLRRRGEQALLATVVETAGSTYRRPGARLLMSQDRWLAGGISGGCLEGEVLKKAWWRTRDGPLVLSYDATTADDELSWSFGLGCNGRVEVLQERISPEPTPTHPLAFIAGRLEQRRAGVMATVFRVGRTAAARVGERLLLDEDGVRSDVKDIALREKLHADAEAALAGGRTAVHRYGNAESAVDALVEVVRPARPLFVFGNGQDAVPLVRLAAELGFHVTLVANRPSGVPPDAFREADVFLTATPETAGAKVVLAEDAAVIVMTHNLAHDQGFLRLALESPCAYVGALGPRVRTEEMLNQLQQQGFVLTEGHHRRLHSPTGLDLGGEQSEEIALAILGEVLASASAREGASLRLRAGPIHPRAAEKAG